MDTFGVQGPLPCPPERSPPGGPNQLHRSRVIEAVCCSWRQISIVSSNRLWARASCFFYDDELRTLLLLDRWLARRSAPPQRLSIALPFFGLLARQLLAQAKAALSSAIATCAPRLQALSFDDVSAETLGIGTWLRPCSLLAQRELCGGCVDLDPGLLHQLPSLRRLRLAAHDENSLQPAYVNSERVRWLPAEQLACASLTSLDFGRCSHAQLDSNAALTQLTQLRRSA